MEFSSKAPYPEVAVAEKNSFYALAMLSNMGGRTSEMSAVGSYFYNHLFTASSPEIALIFHKISMVEMHHLEIFGRLAGLLGADPRLWESRQGRKVYWSPGYITYPKDLKSALKASIDSETSTISKYTRQISMIRDKNITAMLERIIADEKVHISIFKNLLEQCD